MLEILIFSSSVALGIICAIFLYRYISMKKYDKPNLIGNVKYELNNLYFEKSVAIDALGKIKQFFDEKKIDEYERDRLSRKYINMLDNYNKRVFQLNPILEAQEIYEYKKQLESLLTDYTRRIDLKLANMTGYQEFKNKVSKTSTKKGATEALRGGGVEEGERSGVGVGVVYGGARDTISASTSAPPPPSIQTPTLSPENKTTSELHSEVENKGAHTSLVRRIKSSLMKIGSEKFDEDKIKDNSLNSSKNVENLLKLDEKNIKENTIETTASIHDDEANNIHQTLSKIEPDLESISKDKISNDSGRTEKVNIDTKEIDKIQSDILKTLKRLEDS